MAATNEDIRAVYTQLCESYRAIDDFRTKLLGFLPLATGGLFFFIGNRENLLGKAAESTGSQEAVKGAIETATQTSAMPPEILQAIGLFGVLVTFGLYCYELYGIRKCTTLIIVGKKMEDELGNMGQFSTRPEGVLAEYLIKLNKKFKFLAINEPFASGIIYPSVVAAWTFIATKSNEYFVTAFLTLFGISLLFMYWLVNIEIPELQKIDLTKKSGNPSAQQDSH